LDDRPSHQMRTKQKINNILKMSYFYHSCGFLPFHLLQIIMESFIEWLGVPGHALLWPFPVTSSLWMLDWMILLRSSTSLFFPARIAHSPSQSWVFCWRQHARNRMQRCVQIAKNSVKYFRRFLVMNKRTVTFVFI
jgi:hypothetical protein